VVARRDARHSVGLKRRWYENLDDTTFAQSARVMRNRPMSATDPHSARDASADGRAVKIVSHSDLFYWWPVWAAGFVMALLTYWDGHVMAIVPDGTTAEQARRVDGVEGPRDVLVVPAGQALALDPVTQAPIQPHLRMARSNALGVVYATVLMVVLLITNVRLRGVWSLAIIVAALLVSVFLAWFGWWDDVLRRFEVADIHINAFGYLCVSTALFVIWLFVFVFFDRVVYAAFSRGQFRMNLFVGSGETAYEVMGMVLHKRRDDLFRHWLLGFSSGDLIVKTGGANPQTFELPNVLFVDSKLKRAQRMMQEREVT